MQDQTYERVTIAAATNNWHLLAFTLVYLIIQGVEIYDGILDQAQQILSGIQDESLDEVQQQLLSGNPGKLLTDTFRSH